MGNAFGGTKGVASRSVFFGIANMVSPDNKIVWRSRYAIAPECILNGYVTVK
jgi:hypothetical protein